MKEKPIKNSEAIWSIQNQQEFRNHGGTFTGKIVRFVPPPRGKMGDAEYRQMLKDFQQKESLYVIFSYATPIAWANVGISDFLAITEKNYSATTSKHLGIVHRAKNGPRCISFKDFDAERTDMKIMPGQKPADNSKNQFIIYGVNGEETMRLEASGESEYSLVMSLQGLAKVWDWHLPPEVTTFGGLSNVSVKSWPLATNEYIKNMRGSIDCCGTLQFVRKARSEW